MTAALEERSDILVVDDLPDKLLVFSTVLESLGQNVVQAGTGAQALREVLARDFAVILLDVNMPDIDGFETARLIRSHRKSAHTPIIFITAYADEMQTARGYSLGAVDYILAPVVPEVLRSKVKVFVDLHQMQRRIRRQADERVALAEAVAARQVAEANDRRSRFLAHASRQLSASLELPQSLRRLAELVLPDLGELALVTLFSPSGQVEHCYVGTLGSEAHPPTLREVGCADLRAPWHELLVQAVHTHRGKRLQAAAIAHWQAPVEGLPSPPLHSIAVTPLLLGDRALGALLIGTGRSDPPALHADDALLDELAGRAAISLENARLYQSLAAEIVERRAAENELRQVNQRKDEFLAILSHELRNPLSPIRSAVEVIRRIAPRDDAQLTWATDVVDRQAHHLTGLVDELLDVARINRGVITLQRRAVDLNAVIAHGVDIARATIESRSHTLVLDQPGAPLWLNGDFARLSQVVANLLDNAAKYSDNGSRIELKLAQQDGCAVLTVRDNGMGIDAALLPRIFDLFTQGARTPDRRHGGLGVGLTLVQRLVALHDGEVQARSAGPGQGTEFEVRLPGCREAEQPESPAVAPDAAAGCDVLIVDPNRDAAETIATGLRRAGHQVQVVGGGQEALDSAAFCAPQAVVLDLSLPDLNGYEVARRLRELPGLRTAVIVALGGHGPAQDPQRPRATHVDLHMARPADPQALVEKIARLQSGQAAREHGLPQS
ncbi:MAG TPA: response regulator [Burkholderiaceae bacterium]|nr:response regulator [Burkholderiaceae bacterium]